MVYNIEFLLGTSTYAINTGAAGNGHQNLMRVLKVSSNAGWQLPERILFSPWVFNEILIQFESI